MARHHRRRERHERQSIVRCRNARGLRARLRRSPSRPHTGTCACRGRAARRRRRSVCRKHLPCDGREELPARSRGRASHREHRGHVEDRRRTAARLPERHRRAGVHRRRAASRRRWPRAGSAIRYRPASLPRSRRQRRRGHVQSRAEPARRRGISRSRLRPHPDPAVSGTARSRHARRPRGRKSAGR